MKAPRFRGAFVVPNFGLDTPALLARNYEDYQRVLTGEVKV